MATSPTFATHSRATTRSHHSTLTTHHSPLTTPPSPLTTHAASRADSHPGSASWAHPARPARRSGGISRGRNTSRNRPSPSGPVQSGCQVSPADSATRHLISSSNRKYRSVSVADQSEWSRSTRTTTSRVPGGAGSNRRLPGRLHAAVSPVFLPSAPVAPSDAISPDGLFDPPALGEPAR